MRAFVAKPYEEYRPRIEAEIERLKVLNPGHTAEQLRAHVEEQFAFSASERSQFHEKFDKRHMTEYVTVALLAHALSEAIANALLAIGLANVGAEAVFSVLERAEFREKWLVGPKAFAPAYEFPRGTTLHETLVMLARQRNALVHNKIELTVENQQILAGSNVLRHGYEEEGRWIRRFFNLPYDLAEFAQKTLRPVPLMLLFDRAPIEGVP